MSTSAWNAAGGLSDQRACNRGGPCGGPGSSATGTAQSFGVVVGAGRAAAQYEYIVVARDGTAVGVSTLAVDAQDTLPQATLDDLAGRVLDRLGAAS